MELHTPHTPCRLYVGTSGYSYTEWVEAGFYPPDTPTVRMLPLYARSFPITELNHTWYQMPRAATLEQHRCQVGSEFRFAVKLTRCFTHKGNPHRWPTQIAAYRDGVSPLLQSGQLAAVLVQLPFEFNRTAAHRKHLSALLDQLTGLPLAIEFRHRSWAVDRVLNELQRRRICLVAVDAPPLSDRFPVTDAVTHPDLLYVRFYGRCAKGWRTASPRHRFDYDYSDEELAEWIETRLAPMSRQAAAGFLFFANYIRAQAPQNALRLIRLLHQSGLPVVVPTSGRELEQKPRDFFP